MTDDLDGLKRNTDMVALLTSYGVELKQRGNEYDLLCIWHDESNPSAQVYIKDGLQRIHCKSCGQGGSVIDIVMELDGVNEAEAIKRLRTNGFHRDDTRIKTAAPIKASVWQHEVAPDDTPPAFAVKGLEYQAHWTYRNEEGKVLGYVVRYINEKGEKDYRPWTYGRMTPSMNPAWACKGWTSGRRPLYGLDKLAKRPTSRVLITEGEKTADAAAVLMPGMVCITWPGGANGIRAVDWTPLAGRNILLIPDADYAGEQAMYGVAAYLLAIGCAVRQLDTSDQGHAVCKGWDLADALADGWRTDDLLTFAEDRITPLTSREIEKHRAEEEKKTVQNANIETGRPDDMPPSALLMEGEFTEAIEIPDIPLPNVVQIKPHTAIKESVVPDDPSQFFSHSNLARIWVESDTDWLYCHTRNKWMHFDGSRWQLDRTKSACATMDKKMQEAGSWIEAMQLSTKDRRALRNVPMIVSILSAAQWLVPANEPDFDKDPWTLGTPDGTVDLRTGLLREARREDYISKQTLISPKAGPMPCWDMVLDRCSKGDPEMRRYYQKWAGYTLTGDASEEGFLVIHGAQGSGKGKFVSALLEIMGEYAISFQVQLLMENKYGAASHDVAMFSGARMASTTESTSGHRWNEGLVKALTGRDRQMACRKYENPFEFEPIAKIWMSCNEKPQLTSADGMERRLHVCEFPGSIPKEDRILDLPEKLKAEYPAILAWAIEGCLIWQKEGLSRPAPVEQAVAEYIDTQDIIADWLGEKTEKHESWIKQTDLYRSYNEYVKAAGQGALGSVRLGPELKKRGYEQKRSNGVWRWYGLRLSDHAEPAPSWNNDF